MIKLNDIVEKYEGKEILGTKKLVIKFLFRYIVSLLSFFIPLATMLSLAHMSIYFAFILLVVLILGYFMLESAYWSEKTARILNKVVKFWILYLVFFTIISVVLLIFI